MKHVLFLLLIISLLTACQKKTLPVITERASTFSLPNSDTAALVADPASGRLIFSNRCARCHGLPETARYTEKRWETIIALMSPRARLNRQEALDVLSFVKANAAK